MKESPAASADVATAALGPVVQTVTVDLEPAAAFLLYTQGMDRWWPLAKYSAARAEAETCWMELHEGGRIMERARDGREFEWGRILRWEPPARLVHSWYPAGTPDNATEVEVWFEASPDGTRVTLEHRGWQKMGERAAEIRAGYEEGWPEVLGSLVEVARKEASKPPRA